MVVAPEFQGLGVGFKMLSCWPIIGRKYKIPAAMISITNPKVLRFADSIGFKTYAEFVYSEYQNGNDQQILIPTSDTPSCTYVGMKF